MVSKNKFEICIECGSPEHTVYTYTEEERDNLVIACGIKYMGLIQSIEQVKKMRVSDEEVLAIWELMIDLGVEKIA
jgi:hypothetical protein